MTGRAEQTNNVADYSTLWQQRPEMLAAVIDGRANILSMSPALFRLMGFATDTIIGGKLWDFIDMRTFDATMKAVNDAALGRGKQTVVNAYTDAKGRLLWFRWTIPPPDAEGIFTSWAEQLPRAPEEYASDSTHRRNLS